MSPIPYHQLRSSITAGRLVRALLKDGFALRRSSRSGHRKYTHADGRRVTVSFHGSSETFPTKTLKRIIEEQALWEAEDLRRLNLLK